jgi:hypothetical protein
MGTLHGWLYHLPGMGGFRARISDRLFILKNADKEGLLSFRVKRGDLFLWFGMLLSEA